ncbi:hypothetical protein BD289DRAFT_378406, partial [Coniella lustricola]
LWITEWLWGTAVTAFRLAILLLYIDIFSTQSFRTRARWTAAVVLANYVQIILTACLLCRPVEYNWNRFTIEGTCGDTYALEIFSAAFNMALDLWVVYLPLPTIWSLQLNTQKKRILTVSFMMGLITAATNLGRLIWTAKCPETDFTYCGFISFILIGAETTSGIIVACVPSLGSMFALRRGKQNRAGKSSYPTPSSERHELGNRGIGSLQASSRHKDVWVPLSDEELLVTKVGVK